MTGAISGLVWLDFNGDGVKGAEEISFISGAMIHLYSDPNGDGDPSDGGLVATAASASNGSYAFRNLAPGSYVVIETDLAGMVSTTSNRVNSHVSSGTTQVTNFGDLALSLPMGSSDITGLVYHDLNANSIMDRGEGPIASVTVGLYDNSGVLTAITTTALNGSYHFTGLKSGAYRVMEVDPAGYVSTTLNSVNVFLSDGQTVQVNFLDAADPGTPIIDPAVTITRSPTEGASGDLVVYTITVGNNGTYPADGVTLTFTKPEYLDILSILIDSNTGALIPVTSGKNSMTLSYGALSPDSFFTFRVLGRINDQSSVGTGDFLVNVLSTSDPSTDRLANNHASARVIVHARPVSINSRMPKTGFAPNEASAASVAAPSDVQPAVLGYKKTDLLLEVPALKINIPIIDVPAVGDSWDISWLDTRAGYLHGTSYPTYSGNSVISGHVSLTNKKAAPFANLSRLRVGDEVIVQAVQYRYIYSVRVVKEIAPDNLSVFGRKPEPWITLLTCSGYEPSTGQFKTRLVVQALLVRVESVK